MAGKRPSSSRRETRYVREYAHRRSLLKFSTTISNDGPLRLYDNDYGQYDETLSTAHSRESSPERFPTGRSPPFAMEYSRSLHDSGRHDQGQMLSSRGDNNDGIRYNQSPSAAPLRAPPPERRPTAPVSLFPINNSHSYPESSQRGPLGQGQMHPYSPNPPISMYPVSPPQSIQTSDSGNQTTKRAKDSYNTNKVALDQGAFLSHESSVNVYNIRHLQIQGQPGMLMLYLVFHG